MFNTALTAASTGATAGNVSAVANFMAFAVKNLGLGLVSVASAGNATLDDDVVSAWTANAVVNGFNATVAFSAADQTFTGIATEGVTSAVPAARNIWTVVVKIDNASDGDTTADADEIVLQMTALV